MKNKQLLVVGHIGVQPTTIVNTIQQQGIVVVESQSKTKTRLKDLSTPTFEIKSSPIIEQMKVQSGRQSRRERRKQERKLKSRT